jgi:hypothetical protein
MPYEKTLLRSDFNESKHHIVTAMNIMMFLERFSILVIDPLGKKFDWDDKAIQQMIKTEIPANYKVLSENQTLA